jgi:hypothetical protein
MYPIQIAVTMFELSLTVLIAWYFWFAPKLLARVFMDIRVSDDHKRVA